MKSADRSLALLEYLAVRPDGATFAEIAAALALPRSSAHGLLQTLIGRGYLEATAPDAVRDRRYQLGLRLAELSAGYYRGHGALAHARAAVEMLAAQTAEACHVVVLDGVDAVYLHAEAGEHDMRFELPVGRRAPAHATAAGKALLAGLPDDEVARRYSAANLVRSGVPAPPAQRGQRGQAGEPGAPPGASPTLSRPGPNTVGTLEGLVRELEEVRRLGHAHDVEGLLAGIHCVAAPVLDEQGAHVAALSVSVPTPRLDGDRLVELARMVRKAAARASASPLAATPQPLAEEERWSAGRGLNVRVPPSVPIGRWKHGCVRVGWAMAEMRHAFFSIIHRAALDAAPQQGADVLWLDAVGNEQKQACDVAHLLEAGIDVLVLHPVHAVRSDPLFRAAVETGVPAICFRRPARSNAFTLFTGGDTLREGELQVEWVARALGGSGNVVLLEGDPFNDNARNIAEGNRRALACHPGLRLVADEVCPSWSRSVAERIAGELLDSMRDDVHAFICANDGLAGGAIAALAARERVGQVLVAGGDGEQSAIARIRAGSQHATVFHDPLTLARETLRAAVSLARGTLDPAQLPRRSPAVSPPSRPMPVLDVPFELVTAANVNEVSARMAEPVRPVRAPST